MEKTSARKIKRRNAIRQQQKQKQQQQKKDKGKTKQKSGWYRIGFVFRHRYKIKQMNNNNKKDQAAKSHGVLTNIMCIEIE